LKILEHLVIEALIPWQGLKFPLLVKTFATSTISFHFCLVSIIVCQQDLEMARIENSRALGHRGYYTMLYSIVTEQTRPKLAQRRTEQGIIT